MLRRCLLFLLLGGTLCSARPKTDKVHVANGNIITGEIRTLNRDILTLCTDCLGTLSIKWEDVRRVESDYTFEIYLENGSVFHDTLKPDPESGQLLLSGAAGVEKFQLWRVVSMVPIASRIWRRFNGSINLGYSFLKSDNTTQITPTLDLRYVSRQHEADLYFSGTYVNRTGTEPTRRNQLQLLLRQNLENRYFVAAIVQYARNDELQLAFRIVGGGALGRDLIRTNQVIFSVLGGAAYARQRYYGQSIENSPEGLAATQLQWFRLSSPKVDVTASFAVWPTLNSLSTYRTDSNITTNFEVYKNLFFALSFWDTFNSQPTGSSAAQNDFGVVLSLGYTFNR